MSDERIAAIKAALENNYGMSLPTQPGQVLASFCYARDDARYLLDHIAALEDVTQAARALLTTTPGTLERTFAEADLIATLDKLGEVGDASHS